MNTFHVDNGELVLGATAVAQEDDLSAEVQIGTDMIEPAAQIRTYHISKSEEDTRTGWEVRH